MCLNEKEQAYQAIKSKAINLWRKLADVDPNEADDSKIDLLVRRFIVLAQKQEFGNNRHTSHFSGSVDDEIESLYKRICNESLSYSDTTKWDMFNVGVFIRWYLKAEKMVERLLNDTEDSIECEISRVSVLGFYEGFV